MERRWDNLYGVNGMCLRAAGDQRWGFVSGMDHEIVFVNTKTGAVEAKVPLSNEPANVDDSWVTQNSGEAKIVLAGEDGATITRVDIAAKKLRSTRKVPRCHVPPAHP